MQGRLHEGCEASRLEPLLELAGGAEGEVQHFDRVPVAERIEAAATALWFPASISTSGSGAMSDLLMGVVDRRPCRPGDRAAEPDGHALREDRVRRRDGQEVPPAAAEDAEALGNEGKDVFATLRVATRTRPRRR